MENNTEQPIKNSQDNLISKIRNLVLNLKSKIYPTVLKIDEKVDTLIPNPKLKKIIYIAVGSLFALMFVIIILGLLFSPLKNGSQNTQSLFKKPEIGSTSPKPQVVLSERQKQILKLQTEVNEMKFPESILNIPVIESDLKI